MYLLEKTNNSFLKQKSQPESYLAKVFYEEVGRFTFSSTNRGNLAQVVPEFVDPWEAYLSELVESGFVINFSENFSAGTGSWDYTTGNMEVSSLADGGVNADSSYLLHTGGTGQVNVLSISSSLAYGVWEFDWWQAATFGNSLRINYISFVNDPRGIQAFSGTQHIFWNNGGSAMAHIRNGGDIIQGVTDIRTTGDATPPFGNWYRMKVTREANGTTSLFAKGAGLGQNFTLLTSNEIVNGIGTNPFTENSITTSNFFCILLRGTSAITNIVSYS